MVVVVFALLLAMSVHAPLFRRRSHPVMEESLGLFQVTTACWSPATAVMTGAEGSGCGVADASPDAVPVPAEFFPRSWKVWEVPLERLDTVKKSLSSLASERETALIAVQLP